MSDEIVASTNEHRGTNLETVRVNVCYRPLRICWAIADGDFASFRTAVRLNNTMWGGRYNPIAVVDRAHEARRIVEVFRADVIIPLGDAPAVAAFPKQFPHLINPFFPETLFMGNNQAEARAHVLDIHNALIHLRDTPTWGAISAKGIRLFDWDADDPLSDFLLVLLGAYPESAESIIDYRSMLKQASDATDHHLGRQEPFSLDILQHPTISYLSRHGLRRHHGVRSNWDYPGFYLGDVTNLHDLVTYWNLRATDTSLLFVDQAHVARYATIVPEWTRNTNEMLAGRRFDFQRKLAVWSRREIMSGDHEGHVAQLRAIFGEEQFTICGVDIHSWNGLNLQAPMMVLGDTSQMGLLVTEAEQPKLSFTLGDKPFVGDDWFHTQHLVASLSFIGGLYGDDHHTLNIPYVPELNEFLARSMYFQYNKLRVEPGRIGLIIDAADIDASIRALPVDALFERIFQLAGLDAKPSRGGLIVRQLITQLGRLRGAAVFKIPGVRRLLRTYGPTQPFTRRAALQEIGRRSADGSETNFEEFNNLYIEPRAHGTSLSVPDVFNYLVVKGLFRIGAELQCPHCRMPSWIPLDSLKQRADCDMCGRPFDATRQLLDSEYQFRRSGVMGAEKNAQGAVPVALTLQQLESNLHAGLRENLYAISLELRPRVGSTVPPNEVDFVWLTTERYPEKTEIILGECKDRGRNQRGPGAGDTITQEDIDRLKAVADSLPQDRFEVYVLLAKLSPFTPGEIAAAKTLNDPYRRRVILLTADQLEPWHIYERVKDELKDRAHAGSAGQLAEMTAALYFAEPGS